jgi:YidC/Oxa1 family membrane protein insertase
MDKKTIQFIVVTVVFLIGYNYFISKYYPNNDKQQLKTAEIPHNTEERVANTAPQTAVTTTTTDNEQSDLKQDYQGDVFAAAQDTQDLIDIETERFIVTFSRVGGYIKNIHIKPYQEKAIYSLIGFIPQLPDAPFTLTTVNEDKIVAQNKELGITKTWNFKGYQVDFTVSGVEKSGQELILFYNRLSPSRLAQRYQEAFFQEGRESKLERTSLAKAPRLEMQAPQVIGARDRYFTIIFFNKEYTPHIFKNEDNVVFAEKLDIGQNQFSFFLGPQTKELLEPYGFSQIVYYGFFHAIGVVILKILTFIYSFTHSWGFSIILLSALIYGVLFPFTAKSTKAMKQMQKLQPHIKELQTKYKDNPQKLQKEQLKLFQKHKVNPMGGCLPLLFQFPVFIALYQVLLRFVPLKGASFLWISDLALPDRTFALPFHIPYFGEFINVLPILIVVISFLQQKVASPQMSGQSPSPARFFVLIIGVIFYKFPSCLVLYWLVQNLLTFLYQYRVKTAD